MSWDYIIHVCHDPLSFAIISFWVYWLLFRFFVRACWYITFFIHVIVFDSLFFFLVLKTWVMWYVGYMALLVFVCCASYFYCRH